MHFANMIFELMSTGKLPWAHLALVLPVAVIDVRLHVLLQHESLRKRPVAYGALVLQLVRFGMDKRHVTPIG